MHLAQVLLGTADTDSSQPMAGGRCMVAVRGRGAMGSACGAWCCSLARRSCKLAPWHPPAAGDGGWQCTGIRHAFVPACRGRACNGGPPRGLTGRAHQGAVAVALADVGEAGEVHGEVAHGVVHVVAAARRQAEVGALRVEAAARRAARGPLAAAARVVCCAGPCARWRGWTEAACADPARGLASDEQERVPRQQGARQQHDRACCMPHVNAYVTEHTCASMGHAAARLSAQFAW